MTLPPDLLHIKPCVLPLYRTTASVELLVRGVNNLDVVAAQAIIDQTGRECGTARRIMAASGCRERAAQEKAIGSRSGTSGPEVVNTVTRAGQFRVQSSAVRGQR